jgi:5-methyltetrahydropteroyltriglutamate--homocysteine methyltransferase
VARHVAEAVRMQAECGIDVPSDGEYSKTGFSQYITDRLTGFELRLDLPGRGGGTARSRDRKRFPDAYHEIEGSSQNAPTSTGQPQVQMIHTVCTGPITYRGQAALQTDLANFKAALVGHRFEEAFIPAVAPGTIELQRANHFYKTEGEFLYAIADAMKIEYRMIVDAGFILQIDDPRMVTEYDSMDPVPAPEVYRRFATARIEALNYALADLPEDRVRYHMCWGSWHGPHTTDAPLREIAPVILRIKAGAFSLEAANPRHEHEYHVWEDIKFPEGKIIIPGVVADELRRAPGAGGRAPHAIREDRGARERHRRRGLRVCPGPGHGPRAPGHHVGEVPHAVGRGAAGEPAPLALDAGQPRPRRRAP